MNHLKDIYETKISSYESIDILNRGFLINLDDEKTDKNPTSIAINNGEINWVIGNTEHEGFTL